MDAAGAETELTPERAAQAAGDERWQVVDVREPREHEAGRIAGARLVPLSELSAQAATLDRGRPVLVYCRVGARSGLAAQALRSAGFEAYNLAGGLVAWDSAGLPLDPGDGRVAEH